MEQRKKTKEDFGYMSQAEMDAEYWAVQEEMGELAYDLGSKRWIGGTPAAPNPTPIPMVRCDGRGATRRKSIEELLAEVRVTHPDWFARFEDAHLSVVASADLMEVVELIATAPSERLAGIVEGMYLNN